jgi:hypothetical protein
MGTEEQEEPRVERTISWNKLFYCPRCSRVYFLPSDQVYLCNRGFSPFALKPSSSTPWAIPEFVDYRDRTPGEPDELNDFEPYLLECDIPNGEHPSAGHNYTLMKRSEVIAKYRKDVLLEAEL